ncbi:protein yippee-like 2 isoform X1 [Ornithorhynchus anatinus]|uniref:protein yippee-like 2 isoform X1 n=1 Tax=Ornithorhynchus anatinus TaxID=9258 RepID=UPI0019D49012|nr:protein yippee-like 2 isoform X1 [Ornithorhynchus anatinus]XP_039770367.1 protein yippee-like 2 isoform X1 [Ornithorhynchus anatinus]
MVKMTRSKTFQAYLPSCHRTYSCIHCRAHLANHDELISKSFQGSQGRAYLFNSVVNVGCGPAEERVLLTGLHAVADIYCENCKTTLGWKYCWLKKNECTVSSATFHSDEGVRTHRNRPPGAGRGEAAIELDSSGTGTGEGKRPLNTLVLGGWEGGGRNEVLLLLKSWLSRFEKINLSMRTKKTTNKRKNTS